MYTVWCQINSVLFCSVLFYSGIHKAILKKLSVGGNISDKKVNRKEGNFNFF